MGTGTPRTTRTHRHLGNGLGAGHLDQRGVRARTAIVAAALVGTYWFAFLHAPLSPVVGLLLGSIQVLPMTYLWLRRGLETAIGFHVCVDIVRFLAAYVAFAGIWFR